jgi:hypothetical protein
MFPSVITSNEKTIAISIKPMEDGSFKNRELM